MPCRVRNEVAVSRDDGLRSRHFYQDLRVCVKELLDCLLGECRARVQGKSGPAKWD